MRTFRFQRVLKPWYKRWFSKEREEWDVQVEEGPDKEPAGAVVGRMRFGGSHMSYNVDVYDDYTSVIYQNERPAT